MDDELSIIQLPTYRDSAHNPATTSGRKIYGPVTILRRKHANGINMTMFDYKPNATVDSLLAELKANYEREEAES